MGILKRIFGGGPAQKETPPAARVPDIALQHGVEIAGKYTVRALLGRGGMGEVYLVEDQLSGEMRAAKLMRAADGASVEDLQAFRREAMALLNLGTHPFILRLYEVHDRGRDTVLILEYVPPDNGCTSLQEYVTRTTDYTDSLLGVWAVQFCVAMEHALGCGMQAHRDIKPANLLVGAGSFLKVSDFGLALTAASHTTAVGRRSPSFSMLQKLDSAERRMSCGTPGYIAPEILSGGKACAQSDMFSFGVTFWQLAARSLQSPFDVRFTGDVDAFQEQLRREAIAGRVRPIDTPFIGVIRRCLDADPSRRYPDFSALREDLKVASKRHGLRAMDFIVKPGIRATLEDHVSRARAYLVLGRRARALEILDRAIRHDSNSVAALSARGDAHLETGDASRALRDFKAAHEVNNEADAPLIGMARALLLLDSTEDAEALLAEVLARHPRNADARLETASALSRRGQHDEAVLLIDQVVKEVPEHAVAHEYRARALWKRNDLAGASAALLQALCLDPLRLRAGLALASLCRDSGDSKAELEAYARVVALFRSEPEVLNRIAIYMAEHGQPSQAIPLFDLAAEFEGSVESKATALVNKGNALMNLKEFDDARQQFQQALQLHPQSALAHCRLGDWETERGDAKRGAALYVTACQLEPDSARHHANAGTAFLRQGDYARAQEHLAQSVELFPEQPHIHYNLAAALVQQGDAEHAIQQLALAVTHDPRYARGWYLKAQIEARLGRSRDAATSVRNASKNADALARAESEGVRALAQEYGVAR